MVISQRAAEALTGRESSLIVGGDDRFDRVQVVRLARYKIDHSRDVLFRRIHRSHQSSVKRS